MESEKLQDKYIRHRKRGWRYLRRGVVFLAVCLLIGEGALYLQLPFASLIAESVIIAGWVALWRPMEIFLYELPEIREDLKAQNS